MFGALAFVPAAAARPMIEVRVSEIVASRAGGSAVIVSAEVRCTGDLHEAYVGVAVGDEVLASEEIYVRSDQCRGEWVRFRVPLPLSRPLVAGTTVDASFSVIVCGSNFCWSEERSSQATLRATDRWDRPRLRFQEATVGIGAATRRTPGGHEGVWAVANCPPGYWVQMGLAVVQRLNVGSVQRVTGSAPLECTGGLVRRFVGFYRGGLIPGPGFVIADFLVCTTPDMDRCTRMRPRRQSSFDGDPLDHRDGSWGDSTSRVSVSRQETQANGENFLPDISAHGRYVAFVSRATNLVRHDTNGVADVFVRDQLTGITRRVSIGPRRAQANDGSHNPSISASGRFVAFESGATNLVPNGDGADVGNVFVRDLVAEVTEIVSVDVAGARPDGGSYDPEISANGRFVAFSSSAADLVSNDTNGTGDIFVRDRRADVTKLVSVATSGDQANDYSSTPSISADGAHVAFSTYASNLVKGDTNGAHDVFVHSIGSGQTERVSVAVNGRQTTEDVWHPDISGDGRYVTFTAFEDRLTPGDINHMGDVLVRDRSEDTTRLASVTSSGGFGNDNSGSGEVSGNGRYVVFLSGASNMVGRDTNALADYFVNDSRTGATSRVSVGPGGREANGPPYVYGGDMSPAVSYDGRHVAFSSEATNLVREDTNQVPDILVRSME